MKRFAFLLLVCLFFGAASALSGQTQEEGQALLARFERFNNGLMQNNKTFLLDQSLLTYDHENRLLKEEHAKMLFTELRQLISLGEAGAKLYFLSSDKGYWIKNNKLRSPLKIGGNYKVSEIEIQDILHIDYAKDYRVAGFNAQERSLLLERVNRKMAYSYIKISQAASKEQFQALFLDPQQKPLREVVYEAAHLSGHSFFAKLRIKDLAFGKGGYSYYVTRALRAANVPANLFNEQQMNNLIAYWEKNGL